jgi:hypothetical protein
MEDAAEAHRRIYQAIKGGNSDEARQLMNAHLVQASDHQARELGDEFDVPMPPPMATQPRRAHAPRSRASRSRSTRR